MSQFLIDIRHALFETVHVFLFQRTVRFVIVNWHGGEYRSGDPVRKLIYVKIKEYEIFQIICYFISIERCDAQFG